MQFTKLEGTTTIGITNDVSPILLSLRAGGELFRFGHLDYPFDERCILARCTLDSSWIEAHRCVT